MGSNTDKPPVIKASTTVLEQRRIELGVLLPVYQELVAEVGKTLAGRLLYRAIAKLANNAGSEWSRRHPEKNLDGIRSLWQKLSEGDALNIKISDTPGVVEITVQDCAYANMYRESDAVDLGKILSCSRDEAFLEGYSTKIKFTRTQCILDGDDCCQMKYQGGI